ncbi:MAG: DUF1761 domain-containing protein [Candidatus Omnitrophica bacterium]|nr:DUF1761 domain-containing protein [Candidatus Omnitrophota bacterium]MDE2008546.1 DUF1761 domain-containing protein [Candidatus Omnitrophota bacterium]MDE2214012.1 DUF1761 domain-containing protein [Candidatus Omnitrophota bacterium]MDE2231010.1 DUF1761 domain-containing protein [Candidatus Omnitrophota bacterium]
MCPITHESNLGLLIAVIASFVFGAIWYGPLFGRTWAALNGMKVPEDCCKGKKPPAKSLLLTFVGTCLTVFALAYIMGVYKPVCIFGPALIVWAGFVVPLLLSSIAWESKPWKLFAINAVFYLLNFYLITVILTYVR